MAAFEEIIVKTADKGYVDDVIKLLGEVKPGSINKYLPTEHDDVTYPQIRLRDVKDEDPELKVVPEECGGVAPISSGSSLGVDDFAMPDVGAEGIEPIEVAKPLNEKIPDEFTVTEEREWSEDREVVHDAFFSGTMLLKQVIGEIEKYREQGQLEEYLSFLVHSILDPFLHHNEEAELHEKLAKRLRDDSARARGKI